MMMILEIAAGTEFDAMGEDLQAAINKAGVQWPESQLIGTSAVDGKALILVNALVDADTLTALMNNDEFDEEGNQIAFNLGWAVLAQEGEPVDQSVLLPYFNDVPVLDVDGETIAFEPLTDLTGKLQVYAGKKWQY